jgi:Cytochrome c7 and related cytochrome c
MQIFPKRLNQLPFIAAAVGGVVVGSLTLGIWYYAAPKNTQVGYAPVQPVPYSHRLHAGQMGMDCRYCHANVEKAAKAMVPPTQTCMGCHSIVWSGSARIAPLKKSWESGASVAWVQLHRLPGHAYFDHSAHASAGVGCVTCHGRIDQMEVVRIDQPLGMGWCLNCHRNPTPNLRPKDQLTNMTWTPADSPGWVPPAVHPPEHCSGCHR